MKEIQVNLDTEKEIGGTGTYKRAYYTKSVINYLSGIEKFDLLLNGRKFSETKYQLIIINYEKFLCFAICLEDKRVSTFNLNKNDVSDISLEKPRVVEIDTLGDKQEKLGALAGLGGLVGGVTAIATDGLSSIIKKDKLFIKSVDNYNGCIYKLHIKDELNSIIVLTTLSGNFLENINTFFSKAFNFNFSGKFEPKKEENKNCYIATLCYGDINSIQVITFRDYRDKVLRKTYLGNTMVNAYYIISPLLVRFLQNKNRLNTLIKKYILDKIYNRIK